MVEFLGFAFSTTTIVAVAVGLLSILAGAAARYVGLFGPSAEERIDIDWAAGPAYGAMVAVAGGITVGAWLLYQSVGLVLSILLSIAFLVGLGFVPLLAWARPPLGAAIPERLADMLWVLTSLGVRRPLLVQKETDEYVIERGDPDIGPKSYWSRWALAPFGITFEATEEAFEEAISDDELEKLENLVLPDGGEATTELNRGGVSWFIKKADLAADILVPIGLKLAPLRDAAAPTIIDQAKAKALEEHGSDTADYSPMKRMIGIGFFFFSSAAMGWMVFF